MSDRILFFIPRYFPVSYFQLENTLLKHAICNGHQIKGQRFMAILLQECLWQGRQAAKFATSSLYSTELHKIALSAKPPLRLSSWKISRLDNSDGRADRAILFHVRRFLNSARLEPVGKLFVLDSSGVSPAVCVRDGGFVCQFCIGAVLNSA